MGLELAIVGTAIGTAFGIAGAVQNYQQQKFNAKAQENLAEYNAKVELNEANAIEAETTANALRQQKENEALRSRQLALYGASGTAYASGSPLAVMGQTMIDQEMGNADLMRHGASEYNRRMSARQGFLYQGDVARKSSPSGLSLFINIGSAIGGFATSTGNSTIQYQALNARNNAADGGGSFDKFDRHL